MKNAGQRYYPRLGARIAISVSLVLLVMCAGFIYMAHRTGVSFFEDVSRAKARLVSDKTKAIIEHLMLEGKHLHLKRLLESSMTAGEATDIFILREGGDLAVSLRTDSAFTRFPQDLVASALRGGEGFVLARDGDVLYEYVVTPIVKKPECFRCHQQVERYRGYLAVKVPMDDLYGLAMRHRSANLLMIILTFAVLGAVVLVTVHLMVIRPLTRLHAQVERMDAQLMHVERGDLAEFTQLPVPGRRDEISSLIMMFNNFAKRLNQAYASLREQHGAQLAHADRLATVGEMTASIAHEIKNPVTGVLGALRVMQREMGAGNPRTAIVQEMIVQMERMSNVVSDLLAYARPASPVFEKVRVNAVIERTMAMLEPLCADAHISATAVLMPDVPEVSADQKLLQQLFWNILVNAIQAMDSGGVLTVQTCRHNASVTVRVHDNGRGISAEDLPKLFKPFFTTKHRGTGLGLTISRRIVEQHGGTIAIESSSQHGTAVTITLPSADGQE